jgi:hypothetical protein
VLTDEKKLQLRGRKSSSREGKEKKAMSINQQGEADGKRKGRGKKII